MSSPITLQQTQQTELIQQLQQIQDLQSSDKTQNSGNLGLAQFGDTMGAAGPANADIAAFTTQQIDASNLALMLSSNSQGILG
ncbi:MAG: hypothetical protein V4492_08945 [Chlamydiota bacterium]